MRMAVPTQKKRFQFWLWLVRAVGVIVPSRLRANWRREWEAELRYREELLAQWDRLDWRAKLDLLWRSTSAFWDAVWLQPKRLEDEMFQDLRFGLRMLLKHKGFTAISALTLALGIGANTAIFSVVDALLLKNLPVRDPEQLVMFSYPGGEVKGFSFPYSIFEQFRDQSQAFSGMFAITECERSNIRVANGGPDPGSARIQLVSGAYFSVLGVGAALGRTLTPEDDRAPGGHPVIVISSGYWRRRFANSPEVVGQTLTINRTAYTIIGVASPGFTGEKTGHPADLWIPIAMQSQVIAEHPGLLNGRPIAGGVRVIARLKPGVSAQQALPQTEALFRQIRLAQVGPNPPRDVLEDIAKTRLELQPEKRGYALERAYFSRPLLILTIIVGVVLLIACANVATLLLARASARQKEIATRMALGAGRARIFRQLLTESMMLALLGASLGLVLAYWVTAGLLKTVASGVTPLYLEAPLDMRIFGFTALVCLTSGILFGLAPALRATRVPLVASLKDGVSSNASSRRIGLSGALVVLQVALSLLLLVGAGLFVITLRNLKAIDLGYDRESVLLVRTAPGQSGRIGATLTNLYDTVEQRLSRLPGVLSVSVSTRGLLSNIDDGSPIIVEGYTPRPNDEYFIAWNLVGPKFFSTVGMRLLAGREFEPQDNETSSRVAIINESFARHYFGRQNPIGKRLDTRGRGAAEVIGVVRDAKYNNLRERDVKMIYRPWRQDPAHLMQESYIVARTLADPAAVAASLRQALREIDPTLPIISIDSVERQLERALTQERLIALLSSLFGLLALLLTATGLYGILAYSVARREKEIGIRLALGAAPANVLGMVLRENLRLALIGVAIGVPLTLGATRLVAGLLFGVRTTDPMTLALAVLGLLTITLIASYFPARRAAKVDPMEALRHE
jgi:predicted permease